MFLNICIFCYVLFIFLISKSSASCTYGQYYISPTECLFCPKNTYCPNQNGCPTSCLSCPSGLTSSYTGAVECTNSQTSSCPIGTGKSKMEGCYPCESGGFNTYGNQTWCGCSGGTYYYIGNCPGGRDCMGGGNYCSMCNGGYALPNEDLSSINYGSQCNSCPAGSSTTFDPNDVWEYKSYACTNNLTESCPSKSGLWQNFDGGCIECEGGSSNNDAKLYCNCGYGKYYSPTQTCRDCIKDTYCGDQDRCQSNCLTCPSGTFATNSKAIACTNSNIINCPGGSGRSNSPNIFGCYKLCSSGYGYLTNTYDSCVVCPAGTYQDGTKLRCEPCPYGTVSSIGASICTSTCVFDARDGNGGRGICSDCMVGVIDDGLSIMGCYDCPNVNEAISCTLPSSECSRGQYLIYDGRNNNPTFLCQGCSSGSYCPTGKEIKIFSSGGFNLYDDTSCPSGLYSSQSNAIACTSSSTTQCPSGSGKLSSDEGCYLCPAGTYQDGTMLTCQPCTGNYVSGIGATSCTSTCSFDARDGNGGLGICSECKVGIFEDSVSMSVEGCFDCPNVNEVIPCTLPTSQCTRGKYLRYDARNDDFDCYECGQGSYCPTGKELYLISPSGGQISQGYLSCPMGLSSSQNNAIACTNSSTTLCPFGTGKLSSGDGCYLCPAGTYQDGTMLTCQPCTGNSVSGIGAASCNSTCAYGMLDGNGGLGICSDCKVGIYDDGLSIVGCIDCPNVNEAISCFLASSKCSRGQYLFYDGRYNSFRCEQCSGGSYCPTGQEMTIYSSSNQYLSQGPISCPSGLSSSQSNAIACTSSSTTQCPYGTGKRSLGEGCYLCPAGTYQDGTALTCQPCTGSSLSAIGAASCTSTCAFGALDGNGGEGICSDCKNGIYDDGLSITGCIDCPNVNEAISCTLPSSQCSRGQYLNYDGRNNMFRCQGCASGSYCPTGKELQIYSSTGQTISQGYISCPSGLSSFTSGAIACTNPSTTLCPYGSGKPSSGEGCYACQAGTYQDGTRLTCEQCPSGLYSSELSSKCSYTCTKGTGVLFPGDKQCLTCPKGYYNDGSSTSCKACLGTNGAFDTGNTECSQKCEYPRVSVQFQGYARYDGKNTKLRTILPCEGVNFGLLPFMAILISIMCAMYVLALLSIPATTSSAKEWDFLMVFGFMAYTVAPVVDVITDVAYLLTNDFYSVFLFPPLLPLLCGFSIFVSFACFPLYLIRRNAQVKFRIWQLPDDMKDFMYDDITQILMISPWLIVNGVMWLPWLIFGSLLFLTKSFAVGKVHNWWMEIWLGNDSLNTDMFLDGPLLNEAIYTEIIYETYPQLILQFTNNSLLGNWTPLSIFSMAFSVFNAINGLYRVGFYKYVKGVELVKIPIKFEMWGKVFINIDPGNMGSNNNNIKILPDDDKFVDDDKSDPGVELGVVENHGAEFHGEHVYSVLNNMLEKSEAKFEKRIKKLQDQIVGQQEQIVGQQEKIIGQQENLQKQITELQNEKSYVRIIDTI